MHLYKYYSDRSEFLLDALDHAAIGSHYFLAPMSSQNDAREGRLTIERLHNDELEKVVFEHFKETKIATAIGTGKESILELKDFYSLPKRHDGFTLLAPNELQEEMLQIVAGLYKSTSIYCLSEEWTNPLLWAHYANGSRGICLRLRLEDMSSSSPSFYPRKIRYLVDPPAISVQDIFRGLRAVTSLHEPNKPSYFSRDFWPLMEKLFLTKRGSWAYEKEWRSFALGSEGGYKQIPCLIPDGIIFGERCQEFFKNRVRRSLRDRIPSFAVTTDEPREEMRLQALS